MKKSAKAVIIDILLIAMMILPLAARIVLKILFSPATEGITVTGAIIYFTIPMPIMDLPITESQVNSLGSYTYYSCDMSVFDTQIEY